MSAVATLNPRALAQRAVGAAIRPAAGVATAALHAGIRLERRAVERVIESGEIERIVGAAFASEQARAAIASAMDSDIAKEIVARFFESSLFDEVAVRLLASKQLWLIVEEIADSPSVTAAITQQGVGFAEQVGEQVRTNSRKADTWLERAAGRLSRAHREALQPGGGELSPDGAM